jgi:hypothetical protein
VLFPFEPGEHRLMWWFTQRHRAAVLPGSAAPQVQTVAPLLDPTPTLLPDTIVAGYGSALNDVEHGLAG